MNARYPTPVEEDEDGCMLTNREFWILGGVCLLIWTAVFGLGWWLA